MRKLAILSLFLLSQTGCILVLDGDHDDDGDGDDSDGWSDDGCVYPADGADIAPIELRDPYTGDCVYQGGGGCWDAPAGGGGGAEAPAVWLDWAQCYGTCEGLDENQCQATDACRAVYLESCPECDDISPPVYWACWGTAPSGPVQGGECQGLDAQECSRHDDCVAVHDRNRDGSTEELGLGDFYLCDNESGAGSCYSDEECGPGYTCTEETDCLPPPGCDPNTGCEPVCYGVCVPLPPAECNELAESECIARGDCRPLYEGSGCSCGPMGCYCEEQTFLTCADGMGSGEEGGACGPYTCSAKEYCQVSMGGAPPPDGEEPFISYACQPAPEQCIGFGEDGTIRPADCACLADQPCGWDCASDAAGYSTLTCAMP